jgi:Cns1/TTC4 Wheel domain
MAANSISAFKARKIRTRTTNSPPDLPHSTKITLTEPFNATSTLLLPMIFLYPLEAQSDFITAYPEDTALTIHLKDILSQDPATHPEWDVKREYTPASVECYMETFTGGLIKVGKKILLREVLGGGKAEVVDGVARVLVVPKAKAAIWIQDYKKKKGKAL